ncbi:hypothetical protein BJY52DRAFT_1192480 [Lactarius psammicola]|nr:hypothetical protein BJY52DRAFT_1192480 [Lactarius psammicola]
MSRHSVNQCVLDRMFVDAQVQLGPFMAEWKMVYCHSLIQALKESEEDREDTPPTSDPIISDNLGYIKLFAFNCETRVQISSKKKAWAVAFRDSNKLEWLSKAAKEMGYALVSLDNAEEREGRTVKRQMTDSGKQDLLSSSAVPVHLDAEPKTPANKPRTLDSSKTPTACKTKGKRSLMALTTKCGRSHSISSVSSAADIPPDIDMREIRAPLFFASSYPETASALAAVSSRTDADCIGITKISVLQNPETDVSVYHASRQATPVALPQVTMEDVPPWVLTSDLTRGVASSMHNPDNGMVDDLPESRSVEPADKGPVVVPPTLPNLAPIPLLPGLAEMLNTLQANLLTSFTSQINVLSARIDTQDELIKITPMAAKKKGKSTPQEVIPPLVAAPSTSTQTGGPTPSSSTNVMQAALPVPDPTLVPRPPPDQPRVTHPLKAILPQTSTWAGVVTPANFAQNQSAWDASCANANIIGRMVGGAACKGRNANPMSVKNTEITIACGKGLKDKAAEDRLYKSNPGGIVQVAHSAMECMSMQAPPVLYGIIPFNMILQFSKALTEPLGGGNPLPNKGWMFGQLQGVPTSDGAGVIHSPETLLQEICHVPFFSDTIFVSQPHWQLPVTSLVHTTQGVVQIAFIDETGTCSVAAKRHGAMQLTLQPASWDPIALSATSVEAPIVDRITGSIGGFKPSPLVDPSSPSPNTANATPNTDVEGFMEVGKGGKALPNPPAAGITLLKLSSAAHKRQRAKAKKAAAAVSIPGATPPLTNNASSSGSSVATVVFPDNMASINETIDAFHKVAYLVSDRSITDLSRALSKLEDGWGGCMEHLENLFCLLARYAVKHGLPLTIPDTEQTIASSPGGPEEAAARVHTFCANWGSSSPYHFVQLSLPHLTHFATPEEIKTQQNRQVVTSDKMRQHNDTVNFTVGLADSLFENNFINRRITTMEAEIIIMGYSL